MAKSREKIQQLGFWDTEVSKPDHDSVCLWAYENADSILKTLYPEKFDLPWSDRDIKFNFDNKDQSAIDLARAFISSNPRPNPRISNKTLEYVLKSFTGYQNKAERIVGYADLLLETAFPHITPKYKTASSIGADDIFDGFELTWESDWQCPSILVEAKSVLPTVGELMRQIQLYRTAFRGKFVVVSPDDSYAKILAEQGVTFIRCKIGEV